ncbi:MAG: hypothetical protein Q3988_07485, partial [Gemella sp.]|nr:hypothetical protein [Gemella sp.]
MKTNKLKVLKIATAGLALTAAVSPVYAQILPLGQTLVAQAETITGISTPQELVAAINKAKAGDVIVLDTPRHMNNYVSGYMGTINVQIANNSDVITIDKDLTIDLNGNELLLRGVDLVNEGNLTIKNGTIGMIGEGTANGTVYNNGTLTLTGKTAGDRTLTPANIVNNGELLVGDDSNQQIANLEGNQPVVVTTTTPTTVTPTTTPSTTPTTVTTTTTPSTTKAPVAVTGTVTPLEQPAKPGLTIPTTQAPVETTKVTVAPALDITTITTKVVTEAPVTKVVTEAPAT